MKFTGMVLIVTALLVVGCNDGSNLVGPEVLTATRGEVGAVCVRKGPAIDGTLDDPIWLLCPPLKLGKIQSDEIGDVVTVARVLFDAKNMYVAFDCAEKDTDSILADAAVPDDDVWKDDSVEIFVSSDVEKSYSQIALNSKGVVMDARSVEGSETDTAFDSKAVAKASVEKNKRWIVTVAIPLETIGVDPTKGFALNLNRTKPAEFGGFIESTWSSKGRSSYHDYAGWGKVVVAKPAEK